MKKFKSFKPLKLANKFSVFNRVDAVLESIEVKLTSLETMTNHHRNRGKRLSVLNEMKQIVFSESLILLQHQIDIAEGRVKVSVEYVLHLSDLISQFRELVATIDEEIKSIDPNYFSKVTNPN